MEYLNFLLETLTIVIAILICLGGALALVARGKMAAKKSGTLIIASMAEDLDEQRDKVEEKILSSCELKRIRKLRKQEKKEKEKLEKKEAKIAKNKSKKNSDQFSREPKVFVIRFVGDMQASAVKGLREQVSAICQIAQKQDEVICCIESGGGAVHAYGLAASQLVRLKSLGLKLTIVIDKIAASGGYLMASIADELVSAPFAIIGSIGVLMQLPNFHKALEDKGIEFEQITSGKYKRTVTMFGKNTEADRKKVEGELSQVHDLFKESIVRYRPKLNIKKVATGEYWLGSDAIKMGLVDRLGTSDEEIFSAYSAGKGLYEFVFEEKKGFLSKLDKKAQFLFKFFSSKF